MSALRLDRAEFRNQKIVIWNPARGGWTYLRLLNVKSDLRPWGGYKAGDPRNKQFFPKLVNQARLLVRQQGGPPTNDGVVDTPPPVDPNPDDSIYPVEALARSFRMTREPGVTSPNAPFPPNGLWFPTAPESYEISNPYEWEEQDIVALGRTAHAGVRGLPEVSVESYLPGTYDPIICGGITSKSDWLTPSDWVKRVREIADGMYVFRLTIGSRVTAEGIVQPMFNDLVRITELTWGETAGLPLDYRVRVVFAGWRRQSVKFRRGETLAADPPLTYQPRVGEDYKDLAKRFYRDIDMWKPIATFNRDAAQKKVKSYTSGSKSRKLPHEISRSLKTIRLPRPKR